MLLSAHDALVTSMGEKLDALSPLSPQCCIHKVPKRLRRVSEQAYTPQVVSIGPLHHGKECLKAMEELKLRYLQDFLLRTKANLEDCVQKIRDQETALRSCYAETIMFNSNDFVRIVLVDSAFIIEVLMRYRYKELRVENDRIFNKPRMLDDVWPDMRMLENQLPFFILEELFDPEENRVSGQDATSIIDLSHHFFKSLMHIREMEDTLDRMRPPHQVEHFVDFIRKLYPLPPVTSIGGVVPTARNCWKFDSCTRETPVAIDVGQASGKRDAPKTPSMTQLSRAGVQFKVGSSTNIFDIQFKNGVLEIPRLTFSDQSEVNLANLLAYEQSLCQKKENYIKDYVFILNLLVNTKEDVELLVKYDIVDNMLDDPKKACAMIKNLANGVINMDYREFYFAQLCEALKMYYRTPGHRLKEYLIKHFFNSPWATKEVIALVILLVLTSVQTVCSIIAILDDDRNKSIE